MRIRSLNRHDWQYEAGHFYPAGMIQLEPGRWKRASIEGQRRAGSVLDLLAARKARLAGDVQAARDRLLFARMAREVLA